MKSSLSVFVLFSDNTLSPEHHREEHISDFFIAKAQIKVLRKMLPRCDNVSSVLYCLGGQWFSGFLSEV